ncbi:calmodulin-4-like [Gigantopelta aegis]|uniref:calmodulin-4-like n=1 Tax=Gigantopelta aegis TaxID=1735272 RepID=UPI001B88E739|nr:calmodulin-4-like [Gigantopelta aegis]
MLGYNMADSEPSESQIWVQNQLERFKAEFAEADTDSDGHLSVDEVKAILEKQGWSGSDEEAEEVFKKMDSNKDGRVSMTEYISAICNIPVYVLRQMALRRMFRILDTDNNGVLTEDEIFAATKLDFMSNVDITKLLLALAADSDKKLNYEEFIRVFGLDEKRRFLRELFDSLDIYNIRFLTTDVIIDALSADTRLRMYVDPAKIADLLIATCRNQYGKMFFEHFVRVWTMRDKIRVNIY